MVSRTSARAGGRGIAIGPGRSAEPEDIDACKAVAQNAQCSVGDVPFPHMMVLDGPAHQEPTARPLVGPPGYHFVRGKKHKIYPVERRKFDF